MDTISWCLVGVLLLIVIVLVVWTLVKSQSSEGFRNKNREGFLLSTQPVSVSPGGSFVSQGIITNQMSRKPLSVLAEEAGNGSVNEGGLVVGVSLGNGFDDAYDKQRQLHAMSDAAPSGYQTTSELNDMSKIISGSGNNANNSMFTRAGNNGGKMVLEPLGARCVIEEQYIPEREKNRSLASVGTVIPTKGFNVNISCLGEELAGTSFSATSTNKGSKRTPISAARTVEITPDTIKINDTTSGGAVTVPVDETATETFRNKTIKI